MLQAGTEYIGRGTRRRARSQMLPSHWRRSRRENGERRCSGSTDKPRRGTCAFIMTHGKDLHCLRRYAKSYRTWLTSTSRKKRISTSFNGIMVFDPSIKLNKISSHPLSVYDSAVVSR